MKPKQQWIQQGYIDEAIPDNIDLHKAIRALCEEKNAVILAHYYVDSAIQQVADFVGDSLALARQAAQTKADIIVMCGVHFMAETCKLLCPDKLVLLPDNNAGCSLADSCNAQQLKEWKQQHPDYQVVSYVNTTAAVKALTDIVCTSGNALKVVQSMPENEKILFAPDYNLGAYINSLTGRQMTLWHGGCHVHERFSIKALINLKQQHPQAKVLAHPECKAHILAAADVVGSTAVLLQYVTQHPRQKEFIIATEAGILHQMQQQCPNAMFYPVPPEISEATTGCHCNECEYMKMNSMHKLYNTLKYEYPYVDLDKQLAHQAVKPIERMLEIK